ncbi:MAG: RNA polymerase sigma factor [Bacteroidetes bacterium]|nr:RNA polymerase sigma factor [Bacteroidota bacterium]
MGDTKYTDINYPIIERCKKGEKRAFEELYNLYAKAMFNIAIRIINNNEEAQEVLQDSFLKAFQKMESFDEKYSFGVWLKRIVINRSLDVLKKRKLNFIPIEDANFEVDDTNEDESIYDVESIKQGILKLPDGFRTILSLFLFEDYSHKEISELLKISEGTSKSQYSRAKKKLIEILKLNIISND